MFKKSIVAFFKGISRFIVAFYKGLKMSRFFKGVICFLYIVLLAIPVFIIMGIALVIERGGEKVMASKMEDFASELWFWLVDKWFPFYDPNS